MRNSIGWQKRPFVWLSCFVFLAVAISSAAAQASDSSTQPSPSTNYLNSDGTINWQLLDQASQQLLQTANAAAASADSVQSSLQASQAQYTLLLQVSKQADQAARTAVGAALLHNDLWRSGALVASGALVGCFIDKKDIGWGALAGAASAGIWELIQKLHLFHHPAPAPLPAEESPTQ